MRRILGILLVLMLACSMALAEEIEAADLALQMAQKIPEMADVREMPLANGMQNRAIWTDTRTDAKCILTVWPDDQAAQDAALELGTRHTAARQVENCLLEIDTDLAVEHIEAYRMVLAEVLGVQLVEESPDYILNVNTRKFHKPSCASVDEMKENNKQPYIGERDKLTEKGYEACKRCKP